MKYIKDDINLIYLMGVAVGASMNGSSGVDAMLNEINRLKDIGKEPSDIIDIARNNQKRKGNE